LFLYDGWGTMVISFNNWTFELKYLKVKWSSSNQRHKWEEVLFYYCRITNFILEIPNSLKGNLQIIYPQIGRLVESSSTFTLTLLEKIQAHRYLLLNCSKVQPYVE